VAGYPRSNRHFIKEIASQSENAIEFATVIDGDFIKIPYVNQSPTPQVNIATITQERSRVERVFHIFQTCGKNEPVVKSAAAKPMSSMFGCMMICQKYNLLTE
jgi:hypothetical protein